MLGGKVIITNRMEYRCSLSNKRNIFQFFFFLNKCINDLNEISIFIKIHERKKYQMKFVHVLDSG